MIFHTSRIRLLVVVGLLALVAPVLADDVLVRREWVIDGVTREGLVYVPASGKTEPAPVIFAFHGHGGTMKNSAAMFSYHTRWPEAICVYMQGLPTPGRLTDPEGKRPGWQSAPGGQGDRDLKFFDAVLESLKHDYKVDEKRIYATGHSNGGGFTYLLWLTRGDVFAAIAPSSAAASGMQQMMTTLKPKPLLHVAGEKDPLVKFEWQKAAMETARKINQCGEGKPWEKYCTWYESKAGTPVVTLIHPGTHKFLSEAPAIIVKFFKEQKKP